MRCLLAVDSGGTKCDALLVDETGRVLGRGRRDFTHRRGQLFLGGLGRSQLLIDEAIEEALASHLPIEELHVAGPYSANLPTLVGKLVAHSVTEKDGPLVMAGVTYGVVVLAGTGAFVYGKAPDGREVLLDGIGPLYGDYGSGFQIGLAAVRACGRSDWHKSCSTSLRDRVQTACYEMAGKPPDFRMTLYMSESRDRSEIASLAQIVAEEARNGDEVAQQILMQAATDLTFTVRCVVEKLNIEKEALSMIATGGVAVNCPPFWNELCRQVAVFAPHFVPITPTAQPVQGMLLVMAKQLGLDSFQLHPVG